MHRRHYIRILDWIEHYSRTAGASMDNWQAEVFDDITEQGSRIHHVPLSPTAQGPLIGLCGDKFFCSVCPDKERPDTLFVTRIESADLRLPKVAPVQLVADFGLLTQSSPIVPAGSDIGQLFALSASPDTGRTADLGDHVAAYADLSSMFRAASTPGKATRKFIEDHAQKALDWCLPTIPASAGEDAATVLDGLQRIWKRHRLARFSARPGVRIEQLLAGRIRPRSLNSKDLEGLRSLFSASTFERWLAEEDVTAVSVGGVVHETINALGPTPWSTGIWVHALQGSTPDALRIVLHELAQTASQTGLAIGDGPVDELMDALDEASTDDGVLGDLVRQARNSSAPLAMLLDWAGKLEVAARESNGESAAPSRDPAVQRPRRGRSGTHARHTFLPPRATSATRTAIAGTAPVPLAAAIRNAVTPGGSEPNRSTAAMLQDSPARIMRRSGAVKPSPLGAAADNKSEPLTYDVPGSPTPSETTNSAALLPTDSRVNDKAEEPPQALPADELTLQHSRTAGAYPWLLSILGNSPEEISDVACEVAARASAMAAAFSSAGDGASLLGAIDQLNSLMAAAGDWTERLPLVDQLDQQIVESERLHGLAFECLGEEVTLLVELQLDTNAVAEILPLVQDRQSRLEQLPGWLWADPAETDGESGKAGPAESTPVATSPAVFFRALSDPSTRRLVYDAVQRLEHVPSRLVESLATLPPPAPGTSREVHIERALTNIEKEATGIPDAPAEHRPWVDRLLEQGMRATEVQTILDRAVELLEGLGVDLAASICTDLNVMEAAQDGLQLLDDGFARKHVASQFPFPLDTVQPNQWQSIPVTVQPATNPAPTPAAPHQYTLEHDYVDQHRSRVPLVFREYPGKDDPYGYVRIPLLLRAREPSDVTLSLRTNVLSAHREAWTRTWRDPSPAQVVIASMGWSGAREGYTHEISLEIPIRGPESVKGRFRVEVTVQDATGEDVLVAPRLFEWDELKLPPPAPKLHWPEGLPPQEALKSPIGPQSAHQEILARLSDRSSFAVIAPRRFGKSTLVDYLRQTVQKKSGKNALALYVPPPIVCTEHSGPAGIDLDDVWTTLSQRMQDGLGVSLNYHAGEQYLGRTAFDHAARHARTKRYKGILILVDEAQLLFRHGPVLGDRLKDCLERYWQARNDRVPVLFGLVGLPPLSERAGTNLMAHLRPLTFRLFEEQELNRLILSVTKETLHTTAQARRELILRSGNLFILKTLIEGLVRLVTREERNWVTGGDVVNVVAELKERLREGTETVVANYIRDPLNDAESVNEWKPKPAFATAVAMALPRLRALPREEKIGQLLDQLNEWCQTIAQRGGRSSIYSRKNVLDHVDTLRQLEVLDDDGWGNPLLQIYLEGIGSGFPHTDAERDSLLRGAVECIEEPPTLEPMGAGGQAELFRFPDGTRQLALRRVPLSSEDERERFLARVHMLGEMRDKIRSSDGSRYIYDLQRIGLSTDGASGIEVYAWIDGKTLEDSRGRLAARATAELGHKIATGLAALHGQRILHRDIRPRNVVLSTDEYRPVLIDFGLARAVDTEMTTVLVDSFVAPEVQAANPNWTTAADIYALGKTIEVLLRQDARDNESLGAIIERCTASEPGKRPAAQDLVALLSQLEVGLQVEERREAAMQDLRALTATNKRLQKVLAKFQGQLNALVDGLLPDMLSQCAEVALFLDQFVEASSRASYSLGRLKSEGKYGETKFSTPDVEFTHALRRYRAHWQDDAKLRRLRQSADNPDDKTMRRMLEETAGRIGNAFDAPQLENIVASMFRYAAQ